MRSLIQIVAPYYPAQRWSQFSVAGHSWRVHRMLKLAPNARLQKGARIFVSNAARMQVAGAARVR
jgi:hypothetical protein